MKKRKKSNYKNKTIKIQTKTRAGARTLGKAGGTSSRHWSQVKASTVSVVACHPGHPGQPVGPDTVACHQPARQNWSVATCGLLLDWQWQLQWPEAVAVAVAVTVEVASGSGSGSGSISVYF